MSVEREFDSGPTPTSSSSSGGQSSGSSGVGGGGGALLPTDGAVLWLRSDIGLTGDEAHLSWEDQVTKQHAVASGEDTGPGSAPAVEPSSANFNGHAVVRFDGMNNRVLLPALGASFQEGFTAAFVRR